MENSIKVLANDIKVINESLADHKRLIGEVIELCRTVAVASSKQYAQVQKAQAVNVKPRKKPLKKARQSKKR